MKELHLELFYQKHNWIALLLLFLLVQGTAQKVIVTDMNNVPLHGVIIYSDDNRFAATTDSNGTFIFPDSTGSMDLNFYLFGYKTLKINSSYIVKNGGLVKLEPVYGSLDEVIIIGRNEQYLYDIISETDIISQKEIHLTDSKTTVDALMMSGNVFIQKTQFGGGSPVLRGFEANRVLLVLDGIRMNNAIYRNGHLQNSITVDNFALKRMEIIFGPGSLTYGSDAIGGVIHFKTKDPVFNNKSVDYKLRYSSAAGEKTGFIGLNYGLKNFANLFIYSRSSFNDLISGNNRPEKYPDFGKRNFYVATIDGVDTIVKNENFNKQTGTAYSQYNFLNKSIYKFNDLSTLTLNLQYSTSSDVPRYDFLTEKKGDFFKYAEWYYGPQTRFLGSVRLDFSNLNFMYDNAVLIASTQKIHEDRIYRKYKNRWKNFNLESLWVSSFSGDFKKYIKQNKNHELVYGVDFQYNNLNSSAKRIDVNTGETKDDILTRYPSGLAINYRTGGYLQYIFGEKDYPYQFSLGYRLEHNNIDIRYNKTALVNWPDEYIEGVSNKNTSHAFSSGIKYRFENDLRISTNLSTAFRNPNIDDLAKIRVKKGEMLVPNLNLKTENSYNAEFSLGKDTYFDEDYFKFNATAYYTILNNAIVRKEFTLPDGSGIYIDGQDTLKVVANQNVEKEEVYGFSFGIKAKNKNLSISSNLVYTKGNIIDTDNKKTPAPHIPPFFGNVKLSYLQDKFSIGFVSLFNGEKPIELYGGSVDNPENATVDGTYAWTVYNFYFEYKWEKYLNIHFAVENIFDTHYRTFSSGVSGPGRNFIIGLSGKI